MKFPIDSIAKFLVEHGARDAYVKHLASNNNDKNQIYFKGDISELAMFPTSGGEAFQGSSTKNGGENGAIFHFQMELWWLRLNDFAMSRAPGAKLIFYPQYPEVRLSGFLRGSPTAPTELLSYGKRGRELGRILVLAPLTDGRTVGFVLDPSSAEAEAIRVNPGEQLGIFQRYGLDIAESSRTLLLRELKKIHQSGWLDPVYLQVDGSYTPCRGPNCGGVTLESHMGIRANGSAEPDFRGWELKQHGVKSFERPRIGAITLMTPEPTGGAYVTDGVESFIRRWGYPDQQGRDDRLNFGGTHVFGQSFHARTGLRMLLAGYDRDTGAFSADGAVVLVDRTDAIAAEWSFAKLLEHWKKKHSRACYVPSEKRMTPISYRYGSNVKLAENGSFSKLLKAYADGVVYYDPGIKLEIVAGRIRTKRRSQFRISSKNIGSLYGSIEAVDLTA